MLRVTLWEHFRRLQAAGTTLLVTTHVLDEAERCDRVAFIASGRTIAVDAPSALRERAGATTLEAAFLTFERPRRGRRMTGSRILALAGRIVRGFRHDPRTLALIVVVPLIVMMLIGYLLTGAKTPQPVGIAGSLAERYADELRGTPGIVVERVPSIEDGRSKVRSGDLVALVIAEPTGSSLAIAGVDPRLEEPVITSIEAALAGPRRRGNTADPRLDDRPAAGSATRDDRRLRACDRRALRVLLHHDADERRVPPGAVFGHARPSAGIPDHEDRDPARVPARVHGLRDGPGVARARVRDVRAPRQDLGIDLARCCSPWRSSSSGR